MTTLAGSATGGYIDGAALSSQFHWPTGLASDSGGNVFVADNLNNRIRRIDWLTRVVSTVAGSGVLAELDGVGTAARFNSPYGLAMLNGAIWVADNYEPGTVRRIGMFCDKFSLLCHCYKIYTTFLCCVIVIKYIQLFFISVLSCPIAGNVLRGGSFCDVQCAAGSYSAPGSSVCSPCPLGYTTSICTC